MSDYEIDFNVYDGTLGSFGDTSYTDHMNVTFRNSSTDFLRHMVSPKKARLEQGR